MTRRAAPILFAPVAICLVLVGATVSQVPEKKFVTKDGKRPNAMFAPGVMVGKTLYVAGKGDYRPEAPFPEKVKNCLNEVRKVLQTAGLDMQHVVKSFVYLEDHNKFAEFNKEYAEFFKSEPPARTTLGVAEVPGDSRVEITCIAYSDLAEKKPVGSPPPGLPFSPGVRAGDTVYISGKGDHLADGGHPPTFEAQVRQCMKNVEATLKQAGLDFRNVVMSHVFLDKADNLAVTNKVYGEFFEKGNEPACATVMVDWMPGGSHVEITCIATTDLAGRKVVRPAGQNGSTDGAVTASPAVWAGNTLYVSGLSGLNNKSTALGEQVHQMARNHVAVLEAAGLKLDDIVSGHVYLRDMKDYNPMNAIYREYYSRGPGVRTCLMPTSRSQGTNMLVSASFIAARTR